jgi:hypothetical protein
MNECLLVHLFIFFTFLSILFYIYNVLIFLSVFSLAVLVCFFYQRKQQKKSFRIVNSGKVKDLELTERTVVTMDAKNVEIP